MTLLEKIIRPFSPAAGDSLQRVERQLEFKPSTPLTLGIECEFGILGGDGVTPEPIALDIVKRAKHPGVQHELYQHMIEITSGVCTAVQEAEIDLNDRLQRIKPHLKAQGAKLAGAGSLPLMSQADAVPTETARYKMLRETRQDIYRRFTTLGMHIHLGMKDTNSCIRYHNFFMRFIPHLLALSASSPFEEGRDTGFASIRPTVTESMPVGGQPYGFQSWQEYQDLCRAMAKSGSITDLKDLWWDLRPCPRYGTLEIRICDQPATNAEAAAIAAFVHCLGHWFAEHQGWLDEVARPSAWRMRENKWRAMRYGLDAELVIDNDGATRPVKEDIKLWMERLAPLYEKFGYNSYRDMLLDIMDKGNSAERQRRAHAKGGFPAIYAHLAAEMEWGSPRWDVAVAAPPPPPPPAADNTDKGGLAPYQYQHYLPQGFGLWLF
jgi:carboxylate-amine ligase